MEPRQITASCPSMHPQTHSAVAVLAQANERAARAVQTRYARRLVNSGANRATRMPEPHFFITAPFPGFFNLRRRRRCLLGDLGE
jgi:hypothetical protein